MRQQNDHIIGAMHGFHHINRLSRNLDIIVVFLAGQALSGAEAEAVVARVGREEHKLVGGDAGDGVQMAGVMAWGIDKVEGAVVKIIDRFRERAQYYAAAAGEICISHFLTFRKSRDFTFGVLGVRIGQGRRCVFSDHKLCRGKGGEIANMIPV